MNLFIACGVAVQIVVAPGVSKMNEFDYFTLKNAMERCVQHYPKSPCLKKFTKTGERKYVALCSPEQ